VSPRAKKEKEPKSNFLAEMELLLRSCFATLELLLRRYFTNFVVEEASRLRDVARRSLSDNDRDEAIWSLLMRHIGDYAHGTVKKALVPVVIILWTGVPVGIIMIPTMVWIVVAASAIGGPRLLVVHRTDFNKYFTIPWSSAIDPFVPPHWSLIFVVLSMLLYLFCASFLPSPLSKLTASLKQNTKILVDASSTLFVTCGPIIVLWLIRNYFHSPWWLTSIAFGGCLRYLSHSV
jgi:hypothetical protein